MEETPEAGETAADGDAETEAGETAAGDGAKRRAARGGSTEGRHQPAGTGEDDREDYTEGEDRAAFYEWIGGLAAGMGIFMTPLLSGPFAVYCALRIRREKPVTALLLVAVVLATAVFWLFALFFVIL